MTRDQPPGWLRPAPAAGRPRLVRCRSAPAVMSRAARTTSRVSARRRWVRRRLFVRPLEMPSTPRRQTTATVATAGAAALVYQPGRRSARERRRMVPGLAAASVRAKSPADLDREAEIRRGAVTPLRVSGGSVGPVERRIDLGAIESPRVALEMRSSRIEPKRRRAWNRPARRSDSNRCSSAHQLFS